MTFALWCVAVAAVLPIICTAIAKAGNLRQFDNHAPREWLARQQGYRARANAAQQNSWEAFAVFTAGVLTAHIVGAPQDRVDQLALIFIVARIAYIACYLADWATLRSIVWTVGFGVSLAFFFLT
ncbi:MAG: MAPEG family protein [Gammaproteobacteria bacterium]|nr:MAPEG family protein [Gammaproteobacteria bacterium]